MTITSVEQMAEMFKPKSVVFNDDKARQSYFYHDGGSFPEQREKFNYGIMSRTFLDVILEHWYWLGIVGFSVGVFVEFCILNVSSWDEISLYILFLTFIFFIIYMVEYLLTS